MKRNEDRGSRAEAGWYWPVRPSAVLAMGLSMLIILTIMSCSGSAGQSGQENDRQEPGLAGKAAGREVSSLVKKNLLPPLNPALAVARRDLFRPSSLMAVLDGQPDNEGEMTEEEIMAEMLATRQLEGGLPTIQPNNSLLESLNFIYSGLIFSGQKALALILIDGQALALAEGEEIIPGLILVKITPEEVLIRDNQGNSRKIKVKDNSDE